MRNSANKILMVAVVLLLLVNIAMVIFIVRGRKQDDSKRGKGGNSIEIMDKELNMTDQQKSEAKKLRDVHFAKIKPLFDSIRAARSAFFSLIKDSNVSDSILSVYDKRITETQSVVDKLTFAHFRSIRALLNPDQQVKYDEFVQKMTQRSGGHRKDSTENRK
ncbi:MAG TPA: Spy/CpxP family protein refolding chaperone [Chitinophagaceae bacterium]|nr:Spy/CpxP family protein refolding chaperone [Chitinophagaceae bacterium]